MKISNPSDNTNLTCELQNELDWYRVYRKFDPRTYLEAKAEVINKYFWDHNIKGVVVGVSGGIDSAVVLALFKYIKTQSNSPIVDIIPALLPYITLKSGTTDQKKSLLLSKKVCKSLNLKPVIADLSESITVTQSLFKSSTDWATGQLVTNLRTPIFYYLASQNSETGNKTLVSGTTNLDEGAYIGYFAKIGDCAVDIQPISDLHKSEVFALAKYLNIPHEVIQATPKGDVFDGRSDEEMIGTSYDFIELFFHINTREDRFDLERKKYWETTDLDCYNRLANRIQRIHDLNSHKYIKGSNAIHFDVMPSNIKGGWNNQPTLDLNLSFTPPPSESLSYEPFSKYAKRIRHSPTPSVNMNDVFEDILTDSECIALIKHFECKTQYKVGVPGGHLNETPINGSTRFKSYDIDLAKYLFGKYQQVMPTQFKYVNPTWAEARGIKPGYYRPVAINPYMRYMRYKKGDLLLPHYDSETHFGEQFVTLDSVIIYLSDSMNCGATIFVADTQNGISPLLWNFEDHTQPANNHSIYRHVQPHKGRMIVFDHRLLHAGEEIKNGTVVKKIIRTDLIYQHLGV